MPNHAKNKTLYIVLSYHGFCRNPWYTRVYALPGHIPFFAVLPDQRRSPRSSSEAIIPKFASPIPPLPSFSPLPHLPQFFHRPASFGIPPPSPHHRLTILPFNPLFLNTSLYLPSPISHSLTFLISSFNSLHFAHFLPILPHLSPSNPSLASFLAHFALHYDFQPILLRPLNSISPDQILRKGIDLFQ